MRTINRILTATALCSITTAANLMDQTPRFDPAQISVVSTDYAFAGIPSTIQPGTILISMANHGTVRHEMTVVRLKKGVSVSELLVEGTSASSKQVAESLIGILIARPGEAAGGKLYVEFHDGESYLVICNLKDGPNGPPHSKLGMVTTFTVGKPR
jgi:hypothetical protein